MTPKTVQRMESVHLPTDFGDFQLVCYQENGAHLLHLALVKGDVAGQEGVLVRVHSECMTGDVFHSQRCDCCAQLQAAMEKMEQAGCGVVLYMRQEGRGIGLLNKLKAYRLQEDGDDTVEANLKLGFPADLRTYELCAQMLEDLGVKSVQLLTNNPKKLDSLHSHGVQIQKRVPLVIPANVHNRKYLSVKQAKLGHLF